MSHFDSVAGRLGIAIFGEELARLEQNAVGGCRNNMGLLYHLLLHECLVHAHLPCYTVFGLCVSLSVLNISIVKYRITVPVLESLIS